MIDRKYAEFLRLVTATRLIGERVASDEEWERAIADCLAVYGWSAAEWTEMCEQLRKQFADEDVERKRHRYVPADQLN